MRITAIQPQRRYEDRVNLHVDGAFRCGVALEVVLTAGLHVGDEVDEATLTGLEHTDLRWKCRQSALELLAYRARPAAELRRRLLWKEFPADLVDEVIADLRERGHLDDASFAAAFVRDRVRNRPRGQRRLVQELRAKGVEPETAGAAVAEVFEGDDVAETALADAAAVAWLRKQGDLGDSADARRAARRRLYAHLARRGFSTEAIRHATDTVLPRS